MRSMVTRVVVLSFFFAVALSIYSPVTGNDFYEKLASHDNVVVLFTKLSALSCPECDLATKAIDELDDDKFDVISVTVDCDATEALCTKYELQHLPEILLFNEDFAIYEYGKPFVFLEGLEDFLSLHLLPKTTIVHSIEELDSEIEENRVTIAGFFASEEQKEYGSFRRTAGQLFTEQHFVEVMVEDRDSPVLAKHDADLGSIVMFKKIGGEVVTVHYDNEVTSRKRITTWIDNNVPWFVREIDESKLFSNTKDYYRSLNILTIYMDYSNTELKEELLNALETVAESFRGKIVFSYMDANNEKYKDVFTSWGFDSEDFPIMLIANPNNKLVYLFEEDDISELKIGEFCTDFLEQKLKPYVIKQDIPEDNDNKVQIVVHDTWRKIVHNPSSDVVVFFYLPKSECAHCITFLEDYENVAETIELPNVVFSKIDMGANAQVPGIRVSNFPTVQIYPMSNKFQEITFSGPRNAEELKNWLISNLSNTHSRYTEEEQRLGLGDLI